MAWKLGGRRPNVKLRGTKPVAKRRADDQGMRLAATELAGGIRWITKPSERKPDNAVPRPPKLKVLASGKVELTTRKKQKPRARQEFPFLASTATKRTPWRPKR